MAESVGISVIDAIGAERQSEAVRERRVVIVAFDGVQPLDVAGPHEVFAGAGRAASALGRVGGYRVDVASRGGGPVRSESGLELGDAPAPRGGPRERIDTLVLAGGGGADAAAGDEDLLGWIRRAAPRCRRVATVCSGAFVAAAAGVLRGRRVTTHWARADELRAAHPELTVDPDPIYVRDGKFWSSAGVTAGIDLSLALVQEDLGIDVAQTVARWLVMFLHRPGGQTQFASPVWVPRAERSAVRAVQTLVEAAPGGDHRLPALAAAAGHERPPLHPGLHRGGRRDPEPLRRARPARGGPPRTRDTGDTLDVVAARCGLGSAETLRRVFQRHLGVVARCLPPPVPYRSRPRRTSA